MPRRTKCLRLLWMPLKLLPVLNDLDTTPTKELRRTRDSYRQAPLRKVSRQGSHPCRSHQVWQYNTVGSVSPTPMPVLGGRCCATGHERLIHRYSVQKQGRSEHRREAVCPYSPSWASEVSRQDISGISVCI